MSPARPTSNSDVETFHRMCDDEFYEIENFVHRPAFFEKAATRPLFSNGQRTSRNKDNHTTLKLIQKNAPRIEAQ
jgi:hypothetical protein